KHSNNIIDGIDSIQLDLRSDHDLAYAVLLRRRRLLQSLPGSTLSSEPTCLSTVRTRPNQRHMMRGLRYRQRTNNITSVQRRLTPITRTNTLHALLRLHEVGLKVVLHTPHPPPSVLNKLKRNQPHKAITNNHMQMPRRLHPRRQVICRTRTRLEPKPSYLGPLGSNITH